MEKLICAGMPRMKYKKEGRSLKLLVLDGNSIVNRAFYGIRMLNASDGTPTNAVYGFLSTFRRVFDLAQPQAVCVAFDVHAPTFRHEQYALYKAQRKPMPEELAVQMPLLKQTLDYMGVRRLELAGWEADDLLGTVARRCEAAGWTCDVVTGDKDSLQLITDSLRYWVTEMHVDGFRFDLAATLARQFQEVDKLSAFFDIVEQDPVISRVKLIAEPWDLGSGGYQVGGFPSSWSEWNGRYRDCVRDFWRSQPSTLPEFASRFMGSSDLYQVNGRRPVASVNFITAHDGFTMNDLVSYNEKHNEANGEGNRDGESNNRSWNCGVEGPTTIKDVNELRQQQMRNMFATLLLSQGIPMICGGDEVARTQQGNNNAYCQDNAISWTNWDLDEDQKDLLEFVSKLIHLRLEHPVLHRRRFFSGREQGDDSTAIPQVEWMDHTGSIMDMDDWSNTHAFTVMIYLNGSDIPETDWYGNQMVDNDFILIFNAHYEPIMFTLPDEQYGKKWRLIVDTHNPKGPELNYEAGFAITAQSRSFLLLMSDKKPSNKHYNF